MAYPGRIIKSGETNRTVVSSIERRLDRLGFNVGARDGAFDAALRNAVRIFQTRGTDREGRPLHVDGEVGPMTWGALFPDDAIPVPAAISGGALARRALAKAVGEIGVMEDPDRPNRGPKVDEYQFTAGLSSSGQFWCMAFVFWCFEKAAADSGLANTFPKTAHCLTAWNRSTSMRISRTQALADPALVTPGSVFIIDWGNGNGHTGFVESVRNGALVTVEGNSNTNGSANGIGVFRVTRRNVANSEIRGFIRVP